MKLKTMIGYSIDEDIRIPVYKEFDIKDDYIKFYEPMEQAFLILERIEYSLAIFLVGRVDVNNLIHNDTITREEFTKIVTERSEGKLNYKKSSIYQAFTNLRKYGILISSIRQKGAYYINPSFMFIGLETDRKRLAKLIDAEQEKAIKDFKDKYKNVTII